MPIVDPARFGERSGASQSSKIAGAVRFPSRLRGGVKVQILRVLAVQHDGLTDRQLADASPGLSRTHVNTVCHRLQRQGLIKRIRVHGLFRNVATNDAGTLLDADPAGQNLVAD